MREMKKTAYIIAGIIVVQICAILALAWRCSVSAAELSIAERAVEIAQGERDNAILMADMYHDDYVSALLACAEEETAEAEQIAAEETDAAETITEGESATPEEPQKPEFDYDFDYVVRVVGAEARGEPFDGILAVAQCIADTADATGMTPEQVVKQKNQYARPVSRDVKDGMEAVNEACLQIFANGERPFDEPIRYFYSTRSGRYSKWHESKTFCYEIGGHRFFK